MEKGNYNNAYKKIVVFFFAIICILFFLLENNQKIIAKEFDYNDLSKHVDWRNKELAYIGENESERDASAKMIKIVKQIDYKKRQIHWVIRFDGLYNENWKGGGRANHKIYLWIPKHNEISAIHRQDHGGEKIVNFEAKLKNETFINNKGESEPKKNTEFYKYYSRVQRYSDNNAHGKGVAIVHSDMNWWVDTGRIAYLYKDNTFDLPSGDSATYLFSTSHDEGEDLEKIPIGASMALHDGIKGFRNSKIRYAFHGPFGLANRHEIRMPSSPIKVVNKDKLSKREKEAVKKAVIQSTREYYKNHGNMFKEREKEELEGAIRENLITVNNKGEVFINWKDKTVSKLKDVEKYIIQIDDNPPTLEVDPIKQEKEEGENIFPITLTAKDEENNIKDIEIKNLPVGLKIKKEIGNEKSGKVVITGKISSIKWKGNEKEKIFRFNAKAIDTWGNSSEEEVISIKIKRDMSEVPVGTIVNGGNIGIFLILVSSLISIFFVYKIKRKLKFENE